MCAALWASREHPKWWSSMPRSASVIAAASTTSIRLRGHRKEASTHDLKDALDAVLAGKPVATPETDVDGCLITFPKPRKPREVTYAEQVAPILARHCWECHRDGASAPFALTSHKDAAARAESIAEVIADQRMPPWFAAHDFGPFVNRRGLTDDERATITDWVRSGAASGDLAKAPQPPRLPRTKWQIGTPDLVLDSKTFDLPASGDIPYQYAILMHPFAQDTWVQGVQITTDNPRSLHHCNLAFIKITEGFNPDNFITGYVPGGEPMNLDSGVGVLDPEGFRPRACRSTSSRPASRRRPRSRWGCASRAR